MGRRERELEQERRAHLRRFEREEAFYREKWSNGDMVLVPERKTVVQ